MKAETRKFGDSRSFGLLPNNWYQNMRSTALSVARSQGCAIPREVLKTFGEKWTLQRYLECNLVFRQFILPAAEKYNVRLGLALVQLTPRKTDEYVKRYERDAIPKGFFDEMSPLSTPWGYALPRDLIEQYGRVELDTNKVLPEDKKRTQERYLMGLDILEHVVKESSADPTEFLARLSGAVTSKTRTTAGKELIGQADPIAVLGHTLSADFLNESGALSIYHKIAHQLHGFAPHLWETYTSLNATQKEQAGIAEIPFI